METVTCERCERQVPRDNYCLKCGSHLTEVCPHCGLREEILKPEGVECLTALRCAREEQEEYVRNHRNKLSAGAEWAAIIAGASLVGLAVVGSLSLFNTKWALPVAFLVGASARLLYIMCLREPLGMERREECLKAEFLEHHPEWRRLLEAAEEV